MPGRVRTGVIVSWLLETPPPSPPSPLPASGARGEIARPSPQAGRSMDGAAALQHKRREKPAGRLRSTQKWQWAGAVAESVCGSARALEHGEEQVRHGRFVGVAD